MWKRLQGHVREKEKPTQIGNPVLLETTYDEDRLRRNPNVVDLKDANYQHNAPQPRPQIQYTLSTLPPPDFPNYRASEVPTLSSEYSRPSHDWSYYYQNHAAASPSPNEDISPPSSPEPEEHFASAVGQPRRFHSMRDVSPMDENRNPFEGPSHSGIPVSRRAASSIQTGDMQLGLKQKFWGGKVAPNSKVKWDDYSGEPTSSQAGKTASVSPGSYGKSAGPLPMGYQVSISGPEKKDVSLSERVGRFSVKPPSGRVEPWSRATGRSQIAPPLKDDLSKKPLQSSRKPMVPMEKKSDRGALTTPVGDTSLVAADTNDYEIHNDPIKPIVPLKVGRNSPPRNGLTSPTSPTNAGLGLLTLSYPSPITPTQQSHSTVNTTRKQVEAVIPPSQRSETPPYNAAESQSKEPTPEKDKQAPTSRFSWTTYNSATTYQHSPPPSPPSLPSSIAPVPKQRVVTEPISAASSILSRRRPVPQADRLPERKAVPSSTDSPSSVKIQAMRSSSLNPPSPSAASTFSIATTGTSKALPQTPTTISAVDHISLLESQMEDLRIRRSNVYRLLNDLNNAAPSNPLLTDFKRARLVEQRKREFEEELTDIKREEHEIGMKLHRAWKKREREDPNSMGSALWVRRVTS